ncbi:MAG TPA: GGDEF domain-containing protein [Bryobacteraceae bacterium]|nr:GGDEF domain-containing protein [Bryobacteraceae bacterium]
MVSIRDSMTVLEQCHRERDVAMDCYVGAIRGMAHYTIELEPGNTEAQRKYLNALADEASAGRVDVLDESRATLRSLLRDYRDKAAQYVNGLRQELEGLSHALEQILSSLSQTDGEHEARVHAALGRIRAIATSPQGAALSAVLVPAVNDVASSLEEIRKQHQLTVSQLQVEMGVLHKRIDALEAAASMDQLTELYNRREMEERIRLASGAYCLLLARVNGFRLAEVHFRPEVAAELTAAFTKRLRNILPPSAVIARWGNEEFIAMLTIPSSEVKTIAKTIAEQLSGAYACLLAGKTVRPNLQLNVAVVDSEGATSDRILRRVKAFLSGT